MSQDSTKEQYAQDRFDDVEPYSTQQGAHRKEFSAPKGAAHLNTIIVTGGVALAIGVGSFLWLLPSDPLNQAGAEPEETVTASVADEPSESAPSDEPEELEDIEEPAPTTGEPDMIELEDEADELTDPAETDEPVTDGSVDYDLPIGVYNASSVQGYASSTAQELGGAGYNVPVADNWAGTVPATTTVYFSAEEATAVAVAEELGAVAIYEPSVDGVVVVLTGN